MQAPFGMTQHLHPVYLLLVALGWLIQVVLIS
jgi:hypothetical protein